MLYQYPISGPEFAKTKRAMTMRRVGRAWSNLWLRYAGLGRFGRLAGRLAAWGEVPYYGRCRLARLNPKGYISSAATVYHDALHLDRHVLIDDGVLIFQDKGGGKVELGDNVRLYRDIIVQTGQGGSVAIGADTAIQPRCQFSAYLSSIEIGRGVQIAPNCAFYPYNHGMVSGELIRKQPLGTAGGIVIEDDVWLGVNVVVLDGVRIGKGAVVGAGSVVTRDIPDEAIAVGAPARVVKMRSELHPP